MAAPLKVYLYEKCSTCRTAVSWLRGHGIDFLAVPIKERPPLRTELQAMVEAYGGNLRKVFNTSGLEYRKLGLAKRWDTLSEEEAYGLLTAQGMLVKRPFALGRGAALVGFDEKAWTAALRKS